MSVFSERVSHQLYRRLLQQFFDSYCEVIDTQEPEKGNVSIFIIPLVNSSKNAKIAVRDGYQQYTYETTLATNSTKHIVKSVFIATCAKMFSRVFVDLKSQLKLLVIYLIHVILKSAVHNNY